MPMAEQLRDKGTRDRDEAWRRAHQQSVRAMKAGHMLDGKSPREAERIAERAQESITNQARAEHGS